MARRAGYHPAIGSPTADDDPDQVRARGSGLAAGATKFGGVMILTVVAAALAAPSIRVTALYGAIPLVLAIAAMMAFGLETKKKQLERITAEELHQEIPHSALQPPRLYSKNRH